jgi:hypothetical protein
LLHEREGAVLHCNEGDIGSISARCGVAKGRRRRKTQGILDRAVQLRFKPAVARLPFWIAGGRRHPGRHGENLVELDDPAPQCLHPENIRRLIGR